MENKMYKLKDISVVIPSYNNLEYLKLIYKSVRTISNDIEVILFDDGSDDGTKEWVTSLTDKNTIVHILENKVGHAILYDVGFREASRKIIGILHADMIVHKNFFDNILKHMNRGNVVCGTCVEPPIHPAGNEKYQLDAGIYPNEFNQSKFDELYDTVEKNTTNNGIFAPWYLLKDEYIDILGGHDPQFQTIEDVDIFNRMVIAGFNIIQSRDALVYHFTQRGHKFKGGDLQKVQDDYQNRVDTDIKKYVRKWGSMWHFDVNHRPIPSSKYDIGFNVINQTEQITNIIEPYCSNISFDGNIELVNDVIVEFDANRLTNENIQFIFQLPSILRDSGQIGKMEWDIFKITINSLKEYQNDLIKIK
jgi:glycosyltransferase involved in cell wall biosynthesis